MNTRLHCKLGCLQNTERFTSGSPLVSNQVTVRQTYATSMMVFDRPESGAQLLEVHCPVCQNPISFKVVSAERMQTMLLAVALVIAGLVAGAGAALYFLEPFEGFAAEQAATLLMGVGGVGVVATTVLGFVCPSLFDLKKHALEIAYDCARNMSPSSGYSGARGHKLMEVWVKEGPAGRSDVS